MHRLVDCIAKFEPSNVILETGHCFNYCRKKLWALMAPDFCQLLRRLRVAVSEDLRYIYRIPTFLGLDSNIANFISFGRLRSEPEAHSLSLSLLLDSSLFALAPGCAFLCVLLPWMCCLRVQQDRSMPPSQTLSGNASFTPTLASSPVIKSASSAYSSAPRLQPFFTVRTALHL